MPDLQLARPAATRADVCALLGGGVDSAALLHFLRGRAVTALHFDYGQPAVHAERRAVKKMAQHYDVAVEFHELGMPLSLDSGEYHGRNAMLTLAAAATNLAPVVALGIHDGTGYYDCSRRFVDDIQRVLDGYFGGRVAVLAPFASFMKMDVYEYTRANDVPVEDTHSCETRSVSPCGLCSSCRDRSLLYA